MLVFLAGIYGGYFTAAQGIMLIGALGLFLSERLEGPGLVDAAAAALAAGRSSAVDDAWWDDLVAELDKKPNPKIALVRLEQLYPAPIDELNAVAPETPVFILHLYDRALLNGSVSALSIPSFWLAMMLILVGAILTGWFPSGGRGETERVLGEDWSWLTANGLWHLVLPALALAIPNIALIARLSRSGTIEVESQDFTRFCRAKGLSSRRILMRHTLPNISVPIVTIIGLQFGGMLAFAVVVESIFSWPGVGKLLIDSIQLLDRPVVMATLTFIAVAFVGLNALVDLFYAVLDPRVRLSS